MSTVGGINTVFLDGEYKHITDLDQEQLCEVWSRRQRELNELYVINSTINQGWRGFILRLLRIHFPERNVIRLDCTNSKLK